MLHIELLCDAGLVEVMDTSIEDDLKDFTKSIGFVGGATLDIVKQLAIKELSKELDIG